MNEADLQHLHRAVDLAELALERGDEPFGSVLVDRNGQVLFEDHNRVVQIDGTRHPEFEAARWAGQHLDPADRAAATVYTSNEHCPMCAAAHAWVGLGPIVYASSSAQLGELIRQLGLPDPPVVPRPIHEIAPGLTVRGPSDELWPRVRDLQYRFRTGRTDR
jgi:tRNA(Arg) A34 adenosine deaminase TadA